MAQQTALQQNSQNNRISDIMGQQQTLEKFADHVRQAVASTGSDEQRRMIQIMVLALLEGEMNYVQQSKQ